MKNISGGHYGNDVIAHTRLGDVDVDGKRYLYIHEIQSDWAQGARDRGFVSLDEQIRSRNIDIELRNLEQEFQSIKSRYRDANGVMDDDAYRNGPDRGRVLEIGERRNELTEEASNINPRRSDTPEFPNMAHWEEMVMKKIINTAAREGYDGVMWTDAAEQFKMWGSDRFEWAIEDGPQMMIAPTAAPVFRKAMEAYENNAPDQKTIAFYENTTNRGNAQPLKYEDLVIKVASRFQDDHGLPVARYNLGKAIPEVIDIFTKKVLGDYSTTHENTYYIDQMEIRLAFTPTSEDKGQMSIAIKHTDPNMPYEKIMIYDSLDKTEVPDPTKPKGKRIAITGKEHHGGGEVDQLGMLNGQTLEDFANQTGQQKNYKTYIPLDEANPESARMKVQQAIKALGMKESQAARYAEQIITSGEAAGVFMPRYEGMKAAYDIRLTNDINDMVKSWGTKADTIDVKATGKIQPKEVFLDTDADLNPVYVRDAGFNFKENMVYIFENATGNVDQLSPGQADLNFKLTPDQARKIQELSGQGPIEMYDYIMDEFGAKLQGTGGLKFIAQIGFGDIEAQRTGIRFNDQMRDSLSAPRELFQHQDPGIKRSYAQQVIDHIDEIGFTPTETAVKLLGGAEPEYLKDVQDFMLRQRKKLTSGQMQNRDVAKSWILTEASMGAQAIKYQTFMNSIRNSMPDFEMDIPAYYRYRDAHGVEWIRPEEATAAWLMTTQGKAALDQLDQGLFNRADWDTMLTVRDAFGRNPLRDWLFGPNKSGQLTLSNISEITEQINQYGSAQMSNEMGDYLMKLAGIGRNKTAFQKHLLGMGDAPTIDAREIAYWITGQGDIRNYDGPAKAAIDMIKDRPAVLQQPVFNRYMDDNIRSRFAEIRDYGVGEGIDPDVYNHVMHHWIWDKVKDTQTTHKGMYDAMELAQQKTGGIRKGSVSFTADGKAIIRAFKTADVTTIVHELGHVFVRDLPAVDMEAIAKWGGLASADEMRTLQHKWDMGEISDADWDRLSKAEDKFAYGWELYLANHKDYITPEMQAVFGKFTTWIQDIYKNVVRKLGHQVPDTAPEQPAWEQYMKGRTGDIEMEVPVGEQRVKIREVFDRMIMDDDALQARKGREKVVSTRPAGKTTMATGILDPNKTYNFRYKIIDLDDAITSHDMGFKENTMYPRELQNKDRASFANQNQVHSNAKDLSPYKLLIDTHTLDQGLPIILPDGTVISGNGRIAYIREARELYPTNVSRYNDELKNTMGAYGFSEADIEGMRTPVLVREVADQIDMIEFSKEANQPSIMQTTRTETAMDDSVMIPDDVIGQLEITAEQSLTEALTAEKNIPFVLQLIKSIPQGETSRLVDKVGMPSEEGIQRVANALFAKTYQGAEGARLLQLFTESADPGVKNIEKAMFDTIGQASAVETMIKTGQRDANLSLAGDIAQAVDTYIRLKAQKIDPMDYVSQYTFDAQQAMDPFDAEMLRFIATNNDKPAKLRETIGAYYRSILAMPSDDQGALIGEARPSKGVILDGVTTGNKAMETPKFTQAEQAANAGVTQNMGPAAPTGDLVLEEFLPKKVGEYLVKKAWHKNYQFVAMVPEGMDTNTMIETPQGPARLLGIDPIDGESYVYQMQDGGTYSTRQPADDGLYQSLFGHEKFVLPANPDDTDNIIQYYEGDPQDDYRNAAWLLPDGRYIQVDAETDVEISDFYSIHTNYVEPGFGLEEGSMAIRDDGSGVLFISTMYKPTEKQISALMNAIMKHKLNSLAFSMESYEGLENGMPAQLQFSSLSDQVGADIRPENLTKKLTLFLDDLQEGNPKELYQEFDPYENYNKQEIIQNAKRIFGRPQRPTDAGWMTLDGDLLDFGKSKIWEGDRSKYREHVEIIRAFKPDVDWSAVQGTDWLNEGADAYIDFQDMGNIRMTSSGQNRIVLDFTKKPNADQLQKIIELSKTYELQISNPTGWGGIEIITKGASTEDVIDTIEYTSRTLGQDDPIQGLFDDAQEARGKQPDEVAQPTPSQPKDQEAQVWEMASQHRNLQGDPDLSGMDEAGNPIPESKMKLIKFVKKWGNANDRVIVRSFDNITPDILDRAMTREAAYLIAQGRMDDVMTPSPAPVEGNYEDQLPINRYDGQTLDEIANTHLGPMLDYVQNSYKQANANPQYSTGRLPKPVKEGVDSWLKEVETQIPNTKRAALGYGETLRDQAMLNYNSRVGFDNTLEVAFPYQFWYTRSMQQWARRMIDNPQWIAMYARVRNTQKKMEKKGMPSRLESKNRYLAPFLPDWMGGGIWYDPYKALFPIDTFGQPLQNFNRINSSLQYDAEDILDQMSEGGQITQEQAYAAKQNHEDPLWMQATAQAQESAANEAGDPMGMVNMMMSPALWFTAPYYGLKGQPEKINVMPVTKQAQSIKYALKDTILEPLGYLAGLAAWPEETIRKALDISVFGQYGEYLVDRQLANMAADGSAPPDQAMNAMVERQGEIFDKAVQRTYQEMSVRYPGMLPFYAMKGKADMGEVIGSLFGALSGSGQILPEGELIQRGLQQEYSQAWEDLEAGDDKAINNFFKKYPEYRTRLLSFKDPKDRMQNHLTNLIWNSYMQLERPNRTRAADQMGEEFKELFLSTETRDYEAIGIPTLTAWAMMLGNAVPQTEENKQIAQAEVPQVDLMPSMQAKFVEEYQDARNAKFYNWFNEQQAYYALPEGPKRREYLKQHPQLKEYWSWKNQYRTDHPEIESWFQEQSQQTTDQLGVDISMYDPALMRQLLIYALGINNQLSSGAQLEMMRIYEETNHPALTFEDYLQAAKQAVSQ
jgi:hypothetical protein